MRIIFIFLENSIENSISKLESLDVALSQIDRHFKSVVAEDCWNGLLRDKFVEKYNELLKKHEILSKRYKELETLEEKLEKNDKLSDEKRIENLEKLAQEYRKVADLMEEITKEAQELNDSIK